jgi:hypothetical protein
VVFSPPSAVSRSAVYMVTVAGVTIVTLLVYIYSRWIRSNGMALQPLSPSRLNILSSMAARSSVVRPAPSVEPLVTPPLTLSTLSPLSPRGTESPSRTDGVETPPSSPDDIPPAFEYVTVGDRTFVTSPFGVVGADGKSNTKTVDYVTSYCATCGFPDSEFPELFECRCIPSWVVDYSLASLSPTYVQASPTTFAGVLTSALAMTTLAISPPSATGSLPAHHRPGSSGWLPMPTVKPPITTTTMSSPYPPPLKPSLPTSVFSSGSTRTTFI